MALFKRGDDLPTMLKKLETRAYRDTAEKRELLAAIEQQGELRFEDYLRFLTGNDAELARWAGDRLAGQRNPRVADQLLAALQRLPAPRWRPVIQAFHKQPATAVAERIERMLKSKRLETRAAGVEVLAGHPEPRQVLTLLRLALKDGDEAIRVRAVQVLGQDTKAADVRAQLRELFAHADTAVREAAIEALARDPDPGLLEPFFELLPNQSPKLQDVIIRGLRRMLANEHRYNDRVLDCVLPVLSADDQRLREAAAQLLASMPDKLYVLRRFLQYAKGLAFWLRDRAFTAVCTVADDVVEAILQLMLDEDVDVVVGAVFMARDTRDPRLLDGLRQVLAAGWDWWVKIPALELLAQFDLPGVTEVLVAKLEDVELQTSALASLGRRAESRTLHHILPFLAHERRGMRRTALTALEGFREPILVPSLEQRVRAETDGECRIMALELLDGLGAEGVATAAALREELRLLKPAAVGGDGLELEMLKPDPDPSVPSRDGA